MDGQIQIEHDAFMNVMDGGRLRTLQIIQLAITMGVLMFGVILAIFYFSRQNALTQNSLSEQGKIVSLLTIVHIIIAVIGFAGGQRLYNLMVGWRGITILGKNPSTQNLSAVDKCSRALFTGTIIRLAIYEGISIFGLIVCLMGILSGEIAAKPVYWGNALSAILFILLAVATFPTRSRIESLFLSRFTDKTPFNLL